MPFENLDGTLQRCLDLVFGNLLDACPKRLGQQHALRIELDTHTFFKPFGITDGVAALPFLQVFVCDENCSGGKIRADHMGNPIDVVIWNSGKNVHVKARRIGIFQVQQRFPSSSIFR